MVKISRKEGWQIGLLLGVGLVAAFVLQNAEGWWAQEVLSEIEPEIVSGEVSSINLIAGNTGTSYVITVGLENGETARLISSLNRAQTCKIGQSIEVEKRGLDYRFTRDGCGDG